MRNRQRKAFERGLFIVLAAIVMFLTIGSALEGLAREEILDGLLRVARGPAEDLDTVGGEDAHRALSDVAGQELRDAAPGELPGYAALAPAGLGRLNFLLGLNLSVLYRENREIRAVSKVAVNLSVSRRHSDLHAFLSLFLCNDAPFNSKRSALDEDLGHLSVSALDYPPEGLPGDAHAEGGGLLVEAFVIGEP